MKVSHALFPKKLTACISIRRWEIEKLSCSCRHPCGRGCLCQNKEPDHCRNPLAKVGAQWAGYLGVSRSKLVKILKKSVQTAVTL